MKISKITNFLAPLTLSATGIGSLNGEIIYKTLNIDLKNLERATVNLWGGFKHEFEATLSAYSDKHYFAIFSHYGFLFNRHVYPVILNFFWHPDFSVNGEEAHPEERVAKPFEKGALIEGDHTYRIVGASNNLAANSQSAWLKNTTGTVYGYIGFRGNLNDDILTGWMKIAVTSDAEKRPTRLRLFNLAYNNQHNGVIHAGQQVIPEASSVTVSLGLLALGVASLRKHQKQKGDFK